MAKARLRINNKFETTYIHLAMRSIRLSLAKAQPKQPLPPIPAQATPAAHPGPTQPIHCISFRLQGIGGAPAAAATAAAAINDGHSGGKLGPGIGICCQTHF